MERSLEENQIGATVEEDGVSVFLGETDSILLLAAQRAVLLVRRSEDERNGLAASSEDGLELNEGVSSNGNRDANDVGSVELETGDADDAASVRCEGRLLSVSTTVDIGQRK